MSASRKTLITIVGATAIGKTALSIQLANHFKTEIISSDSRQFYKEMSIGTAVPNHKELASTTHHFIQNKSIFDNYNVGKFEKEAIMKLEQLFKKYDVVIMIGGSGLYIDAVLKGLDYFPDVSPNIRENLNQELQQKGLGVLQEKLKKLDIESYKTIAIDNPKRVIRALEICIGTGKTYTSFKNKAKTPRNFTSIKIGLTTDRETLYNRINKRVDIMMQKGLLEEAKKLYPYKNLNALQTVGYKELFAYFDKKITLDFAVSEIKKNTRRFAKRQETWFKKDLEIKWFNYKEDINAILKFIKLEI